MTTFEIIKNAAESKPDMETWGDAQSAYGKSLITREEFSEIVKILNVSGLFTVAD